ncbi:isochorismate synthase DhbC [Paenibacillus alvei]|uniref:isochorismate synthase DhbC n=1 Tax=Paenibacillus TaxID=44249 RepID=UPI000289AB51|nr:MULTISPECIES: isochorismate synthase DhbC [Paenibacillus]EJW17844.1 isochorismate synthase DhbC [Paenibacillus alvei DSM 29]MCY7483272.1 isochorismate synthase DhbC [Paenibacillus alvei]MCY9543358.1 isochorismate synthase DhbC [Paenibacillus alvei]MCY9706689.1 isochorismate synthase DhbC [Paenibacillus alvei]MCY9736436.1 isochorismate synthase DhbC [Paenibacillus alvei]
MLKYDAVPTAEGIRLLEQYQAGSSFLFSSPQGALLTHGEWARLVEWQAVDEDSLPQAVAKLLDAARQGDRDCPVVVGAIPFHAEEPVRLYVPKEVHRYEPLRIDTHDLQQETERDSYSVRAVPEPEQYKQGVNQVLERLQSGELQKVVLSRSLEVTLSHDVDVQRLLHRLLCQNTRGYTFAVPLTMEQQHVSKDNGVSAAAGTAQTLIGASPELLVTKRGMQIKVNPLAGSAARSDDPIEDERRAAQLLRSEKDLHEHAVVIEAVVSALRPYCSKLHVPEGPSLVSTKTMWHLSTEINGELADHAISSLELALALHPTPAICGTPTEAARDVIREIEPFERGFFTGAVGWCDANGDGEWAVTIRCAEVEGRSLRLYAGAGIVVGSSAEAELAETSAKLRTLLQAIGLNEQQPMMMQEG